MYLRFEVGQGWRQVLKIIFLFWLSNTSQREAQTWQYDALGPEFFQSKGQGFLSYLQVRPISGPSWPSWQTIMNDFESYYFQEFRR